MKRSRLNLDFRLYAESVKLYLRINICIFCLLIFKYIRLEILAVLRSTFDILNCYSGKNTIEKRNSSPVIPSASFCLLSSWGFGG